MRPFADRLAAAVRAKGSPLCVGLDPHLDHLPKPLLEEAVAKRGRTLRAAAWAAEAFSEGVIDAVAPSACALKVNIAFYERLGLPGLKAYAATLKRARKAKLLVVADVKRGDIGSTAQAYADAHLGPVAFEGRRLKALSADAVTVNPLLGSDAMEPFLAAARAGAGLFVLLRTSNPGAADFQGALDDPGALTWKVAAKLESWAEGATGRCGWSSVGAVVGATRGEEIRRLRERLPRVPFLLPGVGAQGGSLADAALAFRGGLGGLVTASRSVTFPKAADPARWREAVAQAAQALAGELQRALA